MKNKVTILIITYNSSKFITKCLKTIKNYKIIIIDNNSKDNTLELAKKFDVDIIQTHKNLGYGKAANIGIKKSKTKYNLIINPDIYFDKDSIIDMIKFMEENPECDIQGPKLLDDNKNLLYSCRTFPNIKNIIGRRIPIFKTHVDKHLMKNYNHLHPKKVDWVSGGCIMIKNNILFDERYFLYFEDVDLCVGKKVFYNPQAIAYHSEQRESSKKIRPLLLHLSSLIKFKTKYRGKKI